MAFAYTKLMQAMSAVGIVTDPDFEYVTLLLPGNGTNGAQNNTFIDGSSNAFTITRNGNTTQGTFSPYGDNWSNYFDGTGDYLSNTSAALITASVSTFTAEGWIYMAANPTTDANNISGFVTLDGEAAGSVNYLAFGPNSSRVLYLRWFDGAGKTASGSTTLNLNQWYHIACVVNSNSIQFYVNGVAETMSGTTTLTNRNGTAGNFAVGANNYGAITGYISNLRVTTTAVYTAGFTPSTAPLTAITNTSLLTCQSNRFIDNSTNAFTITSNGDVSVQRFSPFSPTAAYASGTIGGSGYFDGTGDYLSVANNAAFQFGSGDWTFETWAYCTDFSTARVLYALGYGYTNTDRSLVIYIGTNGDFRIAQSPDGSTNYDESLGLTLSANCWNHLVVSRSGATVKGFLNGTGGTGLTARNLFASTKPIYIGSQEPTFPSPYVGYMSSVRVLKGTGYTSVTVPTAPLTAITNTQLLLNFTNAGIIDNAMMNDLETVGNAQISTSVSKFGGGSMSFDGTDDRVVSYSEQAKQSGNFGTGDFTIEFWVYFNNLTGNQGVMDNATNTTTAVAGQWFIYKPITTNKIEYGQHFVGGILTSTNSVSATTWTHIAVARSGSTVKLFINGTEEASATSTVNWNAGNGLQIGLTATPNYLNGYIDDLRITKGVARYTANFTAPTAPFPTQ